MLDSKNIALLINGKILQGQKDLKITSDTDMDTVVVKGILLERNQRSLIHLALVEREYVELCVAEITRDVESKIKDNEPLFCGEFKVANITEHYSVVDLDLDSSDISHPEYSIVFEGQGLYGYERLFR